MEKTLNPTYIMVILGAGGLDGHSHVIYSTESRVDMKKQTVPDDLNESLGLQPCLALAALCWRTSDWLDSAGGFERLFDKMF